MQREAEIGTITAAILGAALGAANQPILVAVIVAAFADLGTGLWKAWATGVVESKRLGKGLYKILALLGVGLGLILIGRVSAESLIAANALAAAFLFRELLSIVENFYVIGLAIGVDTPAITMLAKLLRLNEAKLLAEAGERKDGN